jgi:hypothetical protein
VSPGRDGTETIMRFDGIHTDSDVKAVLAGMAYMRVLGVRRQSHNCACACWDQEAAWSGSDSRS